MFLNFVFVFVYIARIYILLSFTNEPRPFGELHNRESLLSDNQLWAQRICWATNRKIYFLRVIMAICGATRKTCFLSTQPMAIYRRWATKHSFLMTQALSYLLSKATGSKYMQLCRNHTHFVRIFSANTWLRSCMRSWCNLPLLRGGERNRWRNLSQKISIQTGLGLRYTMWTQQSVYNKQALLPIYSSVTMPS